MRSLHEGEWKPGESIPSELDLAARFQVSQGTVRKAIDELAADNMLIRRQGKGTFVATHHEAQVRYRFLRLKSDSEESAARAQSVYLQCSRQRAAPDVARILMLRGSDSVIYIRRIMSFGTVPTVMDEIWLPGDAFKGLNIEMLQAMNGPLYGFFETEFGVNMVRADEKIKAVACDAETAAQLKIAQGMPLLQVNRVSYTYGDRPMEIRRGLYVTEHYHYRNGLN